MVKNTIKSLVIALSILAFSGMSFAQATPATPDQKAEQKTEQKAEKKTKAKAKAKTKAKAKAKQTEEKKADEKKAEGTTK